MATPFSNISDLALITIQDYKLDKLYVDNPTDWATFLAGFVVRAVPLFDNCYQSLEYDIVTQTFNSDLTIVEQDILATLVVQIWLERVQTNLTRLGATMTPSDAKRTNVPQMIKEAQSLIDIAREKNSQKMVDYSLANYDFRKAASGNFW